MDRSRAYAKRIEAGGFKVPDNTVCLLKDIPAPERILASNPLAAGDHEHVRYIFTRIKKEIIFDRYQYLT